MSVPSDLAKVADVFTNARFFVREQQTHQAEFFVESTSPLNILVLLLDEFVDLRLMRLCPQFLPSHPARHP